MYEPPQYICIQEVWLCLSIVSIVFDHIVNGRIRHEKDTLLILKFIVNKATLSLTQVTKEIEKC